MSTSATIENLSEAKDDRSLPGDSAVIDSVHIYLLRCGVDQETALSLAKNIVDGASDVLIPLSPASITARAKSAIKLAIERLSCEQSGSPIPSAVPVSSPLPMRSAEPYRIAKCFRLAGWLRTTSARPDFARV